MSIDAQAVTGGSSEGNTTLIDSPLLITQYMGTNDRLEYIEVHNDSKELFTLDGWTAQYTVEYATSTEKIALSIELRGMMEPQHYITLADTSTGLQTPFLYTISGVDTGNVVSVSLIPPSGKNYLNESVANPSYSNTSKTNQCNDEINTGSASKFALKRKTSMTTGDYLSTFCYLDLKKESPRVFIDDLYTLPAVPTLEIVEILPNARSCSPFVKQLDCLDYVKLHNAGTAAMELGKYRLRSGSQGQTATSSNTFRFSDSIAPGGYRTYQVDLSNSGNWLWFEDSYGLESYKLTAVEYPSAGTTREGQAWMYDANDGEWKWTSTLSGANTAPVYFQSAETETPGLGGGLQPCRADQFRNPLTNRCKLKTVSSTDLEPCGAGKFRNPETNRCKSSASSSSSLTPCRADQFRNPETNRCKAITSSTGSLVPCKTNQTRNPATNRCKSDVSLANALKPCASNQERNPETNRCRKVLGASIPAADFAVEPSSADLARNNVGWIAFAGVGSLAVGYGVWEWRREIIGGLGKIAGVFRK